VSRFRTIPSCRYPVRASIGVRAPIRGLYEETWKRLRLKFLRQTLKQINRDFRCALRSTGQVQQFFVREPCRSLRRTLIPLADRDGNTIIVAIAWVRMYTTGGATRLVLTWCATTFAH
jgi:hypothetical protein